MLKENKITKFERLIHQQAFDYYYILGSQRNVSKVAEKFNKSERTVFRWSKAFDWQNRIIERDRKNAEKLLKMTDQDLLKLISKQREHLKVHEGILHTELNQIIKTIQETKQPFFNITKVDEYERLVRIHKMIMDTDLNLVQTALEDRSVTEQKDSLTITPDGIKLERIMKIFEKAKDDDYIGEIRE